jgi:hypothetical protein
MTTDVGGRYRNWKQVRENLEIKVGVLEEPAWMLIKEMMSLACVHPPCDDIDIDLVCKRIEMIKTALENYETSPDRLD